MKEDVKHIGSMDAVVIIPTYNERDNIREVVRQILSLSIGIDILIVDDGSPDGTGAIADELARSYSEVAVIHRCGRRGRGLAGRDGFIYALERGYDYILEMDADMSHHPRYIPRLIEHAVKSDSDEYADVVIGSRYVEGGAELGRGLARRLISKAASLYIRLMLGIRGVRDCTSGFRCFRREALELINVRTLKSEGPSIVTEVLFRCRGQRIKEVPIVFEDRSLGKSKFGVKAMWDSVLLAAKLRICLFLGRG